MKRLKFSYFRIFLCSVFIIIISCTGTPSSQQPESMDQRQNDEEILDEPEDDLFEEEIFEEAPIEELSLEEPVSEEPIVEEIAAAETAPVEIFQVNISRKEDFIEEAAFEEPVYEKPIVAELTLEDPVPEEPITGGIAQVNTPQEETYAGELIIEELALEEPVPEEPTTGEIAVAETEENLAEEITEVPEEKLPVIIQRESNITSGFISLTERQALPVSFSRTVHAAVGQVIEIPFRGTGWDFLGELSSQKGISLNSRRNDTDGQSFIFTTSSDGTYILKFYRQDFLRDFILYDHIQIFISQAPNATVSDPHNMVIAEPRWPSSLDEALALRQGGTSAQEKPPAPPAIQEKPSAPAAQERTTAAVIQERPPAPVIQERPSTSGNRESVLSGDDSILQKEPAELIKTDEQELKAEKEDFLKKAREEFKESRIEQALSLLAQYLKEYPLGNDEAYWILAQCYEAASPSRNILVSLDYYNKLVNEFPQSNYANDSKRRISYLERYYINIK